MRKKNMIEFVINKKKEFFSGVQVIEIEKKAQPE